MFRFLGGVHDRHPFVDFHCSITDCHPFLFPVIRKFVIGSETEEEIKLPVPDTINDIHHFLDIIFGTTTGLCTY